MSGRNQEGKNKMIFTVEQAINTTKEDRRSPWSELINNANKECNKACRKAENKPEQK